MNSGIVTLIALIGADYADDDLPGYLTIYNNENVFIIILPLVLSKIKCLLYAVL